MPVVDYRQFINRDLPIRVRACESKAVYVTRSEARSASHGDLITGARTLYRHVPSVRMRTRPAGALLDRQLAPAGPVAHHAARPSNHLTRRTKAVTIALVVPPGRAEHA